MKLILILILLMSPFLLAETTFTDNQDDFFIMSDIVTPPTPIVLPAEGVGGGGSFFLTPECVNDSDCELGEFCFENKCYLYECESDADCNDTKTCWMNRCVKLFDMKIIEVQSPIYSGEFFEFTYFLRGVAEIHGDVVVNFWLVKDGEVVTEGFDTIYMADFDEKTESTELFLPASVSPGIYNFYAEVNYDSYYARASRVIEIKSIVEVEEVGFLTGQAIAQIQEGVRVAIIPVLIFIALIVLFIIIYWERKKIKRAIVSEKRWIKRHKVSLAMSLLFIVIAVLLCYLNRLQIISFPSIRDSFVSFFMGINLILQRFIIPNAWYILGMIFLMVVFIFRKKIKKYLESSRIFEIIVFFTTKSKKITRKLKKFYKGKRKKLSMYFETRRRERELRNKERAREQAIIRVKQLVRAKQLAKKPKAWITFPRKIIRRIKGFYQSKKDKLSMYFETRRRERELRNKEREREQAIIKTKRLAVKPVKFKKISLSNFPRKIIRKIKGFYKKKQRKLHNYFETRRREKELLRKKQNIIMAKELAKKPKIVWMAFPKKIIRKIKGFYQSKKDKISMYFETRRREKELYGRKEAIAKMKEFFGGHEKTSNIFAKFELDKENIIAKAKELLSKGTANIFLDKNVLKDIGDEVYKKISILNERLEKAHQIKSIILEKKQFSNVSDDKSIRETEEAEKRVRQLESMYAKILFIKGGSWRDEKTIYERRNKKNEGEAWR